MNEASKVRVDWSIPVWMVGGLLAQAIIVGMAWASLEGRVHTLEDEMTRQVSAPATLARLDERTQRETDSLARIENRLDALEQRK